MTPASTTWCLISDANVMTKSPGMVSLHCWPYLTCLDLNLFVLFRISHFLRGVFRGTTYIDMEVYVSLFA